MKKKPWYEYLWILSIVYLILGLFNIIFAWMGMLCFLAPLIISSVTGNKTYCHKYCGKAQLLNILGHRLHLSKNNPLPAFLKSKWFRYGFLLFFLTMFGTMLFNTYLVFAGKNLQQAILLLWTFRVPWEFAYHGSLISPWFAQFAFGLYGLMLTSTILSLAAMLLFKPRSWCVICPMGTMTQGICHLRSLSAVEIS